MFLFLVLGPGSLEMNVREHGLHITVAKDADEEGSELYGCLTLYWVTGSALRSVFTNIAPDLSSILK